MIETQYSPELLPILDGEQVHDVGTLLRLRAQDEPDRILLACEDGSFSYAQVEESAAALARGLRSRGVVAGDRVCVILPNGWEFVLCWMALAKLGAVLVPLNPDYSGAALTRMIDLVGAATVVVHEQHRAALEAVTASAGVTTVLWAGAGSEPLPAGSVRQLRLEEVGEMHGDDGFGAVAPDAPLMLMFTSGSTGTAKPVIISHGFAMHTAGEVVMHAGYGSADVMYTPFPLFHADATLLSFMPALVTGATVAVSRRFSVSRFLAEVRGYGATVMTAMGTVIAYLLSQPEQPDDADNPLRLAIAGAVPSTVGEFERRFGLRLVEVYGSTETCLVAFNTRRPHELGMCGQLCEHHEVRIGDGWDRPLPVGEAGQILTRSRVAHGQMNGYYGNPEATVEAWQGLWYHTGDLGYVDEQGTLRFAGRVKDVIRRRGENIPAAEVEEAFNAHPEVLHCAAIAVPADTVDDELKVVVELVPGAGAGIPELLAHATALLPQHMIPRYLEIAEALPRTATGKIDKSALRRVWSTPSTVDLGIRSRTTTTADPASAPTRESR